MGLQDIQQEILQNLQDNKLMLAVRFLQLSHFAITLGTILFFKHFHKHT